MILLDTCVFIWLGLDRTAISPAARHKIDADSLAISCITFLEVGQLIKKGRLQVSCDSATFSNLVCETFVIAPLAITPEIVATALDLPAEINADLADRLIAATAIRHDCLLITKDANLRTSRLLPTFW